MKFTATLRKAGKKRNKGQSLAEYALIIGTIAVLCIATLQALGGTIQGQLAALDAGIAGAF